jgi:hypothetical protein
MPVRVEPRVEPLFYLFDMKSIVFLPGVDHEQLLLLEVLSFEKTSMCSFEIFATAVQEQLYIARAMKAKTLCAYGASQAHAIPPM